ncbi:hypothetical protein EYC84_005269 [Monilinia fructicola]|uniref:Uncharacterized protein n=1 Tax=Monilinia fructicola TaxID=38448 RepID=A0A5M9JVZ4_MONFR|nr:hypothetical protein EYC84_005269 [Monilinia fructicola]
MKTRLHLLPKKRGTHRINKNISLGETTALKIQATCIFIIISTLFSSAPSSSSSSSSSSSPTLFHHGVG